MDKNKKETENKGPKAKIRAGGVSATIWENEKEFNGNKAVFETTTIERSYKDKDGNWKTTNQFRKSDLPKVALVATKAYEQIVLNKQEEDE